MSRKAIMAAVVVATLAVITTFAGCKKGGEGYDTKELGNPIVKVDGLTLYEKDLEIYGQGMQWTPQQKKDFIKQWTKMALLYLAAKEEGFDKNPLIRRKLELNEQLTLVQEYEAQKMSNITVSPTEVDSIYNLHKDLFDRNATFLIVYAQDSAKLEQIDRMLSNKKGSRLFMAIEQVKSDSTVTAFETQNPVNLGIFYLTYSDIPESLRAKVVKLRPGHGVMGKYQDGSYIYLFLISENRTPAGEQQVKSFIQQYLVDHRRKAVEDSLISKMQKKYKVEYLTDTTKTNK